MNRAHFKAPAKRQQSCGFRSRKINRNPVFNLFGDVNQVITGHGIRDWWSVSGKFDVMQLDENFRNTNQIVDFCNRTLPFHMQEIGVDMEPVAEYASVEDALCRRKLSDGAAVIVKDGRAVDDLQIVLEKAHIADCTIFTVKEAKGMEFKNVVVIDRDMTANEKYISYTRALAKLTVIHRMPKFINSNAQTIVQGEDVDQEI